ncbi:MAG: DUF3575 domain-containing protein [Acidobacteriota bacterium]
MTASANFGAGMFKTNVDSALTDTPGAPLPTAADSWTRFNGGSGRVAYLLDRARVGIDAALGISGRRLTDGRNAVATDGTAGLVWTMPMSARTNVSGSATVGYRPVSANTLFPSLLEGSTTGPDPLDYQLNGDIDQYVTSTAAVSASHALSRRSSLSAQYDASHAWGSSTRVAQSTMAAGAKYDYSFRQGLTAHLGYTRRIGDYATGTSDNRSRSRSDVIDVGVSYGHSLSLSRRSSLTFSSGSTGVSDGTSTRYDVTGSAALNYEVGRSWSAVAAYDRRAGFVETLAAPSFSDNGSASLSGLVTRRISVQAQTGASRGEIGVSSQNSYWIYRASTSVGVAIFRSASIAFEYMNYSYQFDDTRYLPTGTSARAHRQTVQVSLQLWAPIFQRLRNSNATR